MQISQSQSKENRSLISNPSQPSLTNRDLPINRGLPPNTRPNPSFTYTGIPSPNNNTSTRAQLQQSIQTNDEHLDRILVPVIQNMTSHQHRFTASLEKFINATTDKISEDGSCKVSQVIKQMPHRTV
jgi:hypothetical protein